MTTRQLEELRKHHQSLADAYKSGVQAAEHARRIVSKDTISTLERYKFRPGTCANRGPKLTRQAEHCNRFIERLITELHVESAGHEHQLGPHPRVDDDIPF